MLKSVIFDLDNTLIDFMKMKKLACEAAIDAMIDAGLEADKKKLEVELASTKGQLAATSAELSNTKSQLAAQVQLAQELNRQVLNLKSDVTKLNKKIDCLKSTAGVSETC